MSRRALIGCTPEFIGEKMRILGWVCSKRRHGEIIFVDVRDRSGIIQTIITPDNKKACAAVEKINEGCVINVIGKIKECPRIFLDGFLDGIEIEAEFMEIISTSKMRATV